MSLASSLVLSAQSNLASSALTSSGSSRLMDFDNLLSSLTLLSMLLSLYPFFRRWNSYSTMEGGRFLDWCGGWDLNPRTPTGQGPEPCAFDLAWQPPLGGGWETSQIKPCVGDEFNAPVFRGSLWVLFLRFCCFWLWRGHLRLAGSSWYSSVLFYLSESLLPVPHLSILQQLVEDL